MADDELVIQEPRSKRTKVSKEVYQKLKKYQWTAFDGNVLNASTTLKSVKTLEVALGTPQSFKKVLEFLASFGKAMNTEPQVLFAFRDEGTDVLCHILTTECMIQFLIKDTVRISTEDAVREELYSVYEFPVVPLIGILSRFSTRNVCLSVYNRETLSITSELKKMTSARKNKNGKRPADEETEEASDEEEVEQEEVSIEDLVSTKGFDASTVRINTTELDADSMLSQYAFVKRASKKNPYDFCLLIPGAVLKSILAQKEASGDAKVGDEVVFSFSTPSTDYIGNRAKLFFAIECGSNMTRFEMLSKTFDQFAAHRCSNLVSEYMPDEEDERSDASFYFADLADEDNQKVAVIDQLKQRVHDSSDKQCKKMMRSLKGQYSFFVGKLAYSTKIVQNIVHLASGSNLLFAFKLNVRSWPKTKEQYLELLKNRANETDNLVEMKQDVNIAFDFDQEGGCGPYATIITK